jgi:hypothetical protein
MMVLFPEPLGPFVRVSSVFLAWTDDQAWALPVGTHDKSGDLPRGDVEGEVFQDRNIGASRVTEADLLKTDGATRIIRFAPKLVEGVNLGLSIDQGKEFFGCRCGSGKYDEMRADRRDGRCGNDDGE